MHSSKTNLHILLTPSWLKIVEMFEMFLTSHNLQLNIDQHSMCFRWNRIYLDLEFWICQKNWNVGQTFFYMQNHIGQKVVCRNPKPINFFAKPLNVLKVV